MKIAILCSYLFFLLVIFSSCHNYYKAISYHDGPHEKAVLADSLLKINKYFILRSGTSAFAISEPGVNTAENTITFYPTTLPPEHGLHLKKGTRGKSVEEKTTGYKNVLKEVHLYVKPGMEPGHNRMVLPFEKVTSMDVMQKDRQRTTSSYAIGGVAIAGVIGLMLLIVEYVSLVSSF